MHKDPKNVKEFLLNNVENHSSDIAMVTVSSFGFSKQTAHKYLSREVEEGNIVKIGKNRATRYFLAGGKHINFSIKIKDRLTEEDIIWREYIKPMTKEFPENIVKILNYSFTEIFNNVIDHSSGDVVNVDYHIEDNKINIRIADNGVGIFSKIQKALKLNSERESILHLSKGKFTTDPANHSGEGIFFTSRSLDCFSIYSEDMFYIFDRESGWFLSSEKPEDFGNGTSIKMIISLNSTTLLTDVFDKYTDSDIGFNKTIVAVALSTDLGDPHVSRSQAKRLLLGLDKFKSVILDFKGVQSVGQAFVDEVFRVFTNEYPDIKLTHLNANKDVVKMIERGLKIKADREKQGS